MLCMLVYIVTSSVRSAVFARVVTSECSIPRSSSITKVVSRLVTYTLSSPQVSAPYSFDFIAVLNGTASTVLR